VEPGPLDTSFADDIQSAQLKRIPHSVVQGIVLFYQKDVFSYACTRS